MRNIHEGEKPERQWKERRRMTDDEGEGVKRRVGWKKEKQGE